MKQQITNEELHKALRLKEKEVLLQVRRSSEIAILRAIKKYGRIIGWCATIASAGVLAFMWLTPTLFTPLPFQLDSFGVGFTLFLGGVLIWMSKRSEYFLGQQRERVL